VVEEEEKTKENGHVEIEIQEVPVEQKEKQRSLAHTKSIIVQSLNLRKATEDGTGEEVDTRKEKVVEKRESY